MDGTSFPPASIANVAGTRTFVAAGSGFFAPGEAGAPPVGAVGVDGPPGVLEEAVSKAEVEAEDWVLVDAEALVEAVAGAVLADDELECVELPQPANKRRAPTPAYIWWYPLTASRIDADVRGKS